MNSQGFIAPSIHPRLTTAKRKRRGTCSLTPQACTSTSGTDDNFWESTSFSETSTPLLSALEVESQRIRANFFCPGHKQGTASLELFRNLIGQKAMQLDLPELPALDNLFSPEGVLEESQQLAADVFTGGGSAVWNTYFLVNGTTCGIEAAIMASVRPGRKIILPRNVHQSAVHALVMSGGIPVWIKPQYDSKHDLLHGLTATDIAQAFDEHGDEVDAVLIVSPTYHGVCSNVEAISTVTHDYGAVLIVDEAHGSHFSFHDLLPKSATYSDADIVVQSTHKTLPALTQAAMMHVRKSFIETDKISSALRLVQSTSPNYLLLGSLEATRVLMQNEGEDLMSRTIDLARNCAVRIASLDNFAVLGVDSGKEDQSYDAPDIFLYDLDPTRVTVLLPPTITGYELDTHLIDRFGVYAELPSFRHITFVFTPGSTQMDVDTLVTSLSLYNATVPAPLALTYHDDMMHKSTITGQKTSVTPRYAFFAEWESVPTDESIGRITVETLSPYPPGIPVLVAGERITEESISILRAVLDAGGTVSGGTDETLSTIRVIVSDDEPPEQTYNPVSLTH